MGKHFFSVFVLRNIVATVMLIGMTLVPYWAFAGSAPQAGGSQDAKNLLDAAAGDQGAGFQIGAGGDTLSSALAAVLNGIFAILGVVFLGFMIWAGFLWLTAGGNDEQVSRAKQMIQQAVIGIIVIIAAYAVTTFVISAVVGPGSGAGGGGAGRSL